jgi:hypothetical protein
MKFNRKNAPLAEQIAARLAAVLLAAYTVALVAQSAGVIHLI